MLQNNIEILKKFINAYDISDLNEYENLNEYEKLFSSPDNVEDIIGYISPKPEEWEKEKEDKEKYLKDFTYKLKATGFQILFLRVVITYISNHLANEPQFIDYEHAIRYSCIAAAGLNDLNKLKLAERKTFFENLLTGIRYAGESWQNGYAYKGKEEIRRYAFLLTEKLVKEIAKRNFLLDADSIIKNIPNDNMVYFVSCTCLNEVEKEKYRKIDNLLAKKCHASLGLLTDSLEQVFGEYMLSSISKKNPYFRRDLSYLISLEEENEWPLIIELQEEHTKDRVYVFGKLDVWECSVRYEIIHKKHNDRSPIHKTLRLEYTMKLENNQEVWINNQSIINDVIGVFSLDEDVNVEKENVITNYIAEWANRNIGVNIAKKGLEVQYFWHDRIQKRDVEENAIRVKGSPYITHEKVNNMHIFTIELPEKKTVQNQYWVKNANSGAIKSINILLGRNGSGKTSTMMMLRFDGLETNAKDALAKFFIVYKRGKNYYYSTNLDEEEYNLKGNVLKKGEQNISEYRGQKNKIIYYSNILQPYEEKIERVTSNTVDISSQYIRDKEIVRMSRNEMIHTIGIKGRDREIWLSHKQNYNQDVLRQLYFLYDTIDENEHWIPKYVKSFVFMRCDHDAEDTGNTINERITNSKLNTHFTRLWEYCEWKVYYHNKNELEKIINICEEIIEDEEILYFEVRIPQMSSGEKARLTLFSRLHAWIRKMTFSDFRQNNILLLDELETYMHPEWQRCLIFDLISFLEWEHSIGHPVKVQLFISSNSPFLISDVDIDEITVMSKDIEVPEKTFAQNIHIILKDSFFNNSGAMGEYAKRKVDRVYEIMNDCLEKGNNSKFKRDMKIAEECSNIIEKIGEPLIYKDLREMYEEIWGKEEKNTELRKPISEMSNEELMKQMKAAQDELERRRK